MSNKTQKFGSDYQACAHSFAYANRQDKGENYGNRMFFEYDVMYSYGYHFVICKKVRNKSGNTDFVLFTTDGYSNTTVKQKYCVERALYNKVVFVSTDIKNFNPIKEIQDKEIKMFSAVKSLSRARADHKKEEYKTFITQQIEDIKFLSDYYRVKSKLSARVKSYLKAENNEDLFLLLGAGSNKKIKADKRAEARAEKIRIADRKKRELKEVESLEKWSNHEVKRVHLHIIENDFLRISQDNLNVETSQGVSIPVTEAKRVLKLIENKAVIGAKIDDKFVVTAFNGFLKVGCHNISIEEINRVKELIK